MSVLDGKMRVNASPVASTTPTASIPPNPYQSVLGVPNGPGPNPYQTPVIDPNIPIAPDFSEMYQNGSTVLGQTMDSLHVDSSVARCIMYVISPREEPNHTVRPYEYQFTPDVVQEVIDHVQQKGRSPINGELQKFNSSFKPTNTHMYTVGLSSMSDKWRFVCVIDNVSHKGVHNMATNSPLSRTVLSGYVLDEPINPLTKTPNPNAQFYITASTNYEVRRQYGTGMLVNPSTSANQEIAPKTFYGTGLDTLLFKSTPGNYGHSTSSVFKDLTNPNSKVTAVPEGGLSGRSDLKFKSEFRSARQLVNTYSSAICDTANSVLGVSDFNDITSVSDGSAKAHFNMLLRAKDQVINRGITENTVLSFGYLEHVYGHIHVVPIETDRQYNVEIYPSAINNIKNIFQTMIADAVHFICSDMGVTTVSFACMTKPMIEGGAIYQLDKKPIWSVTGPFETNYPLSDRHKTAMFETLRIYLEQNLFPNIVDTMGDEFTLIVDYSRLDATKVSLNFHNDTRYNDYSAYYVQPVHYGGIASPNLAQSQTYMENEENLTGLLETCIDHALAIYN